MNLQQLPKIQSCQLKWTWNRTVVKTDLNMRQGDFECPFSGIARNTLLTGQRHFFTLSVTKSSINMDWIFE